MTNAIITKESALVSAIMDNNHFASRKVTADQLGSQSDFRIWKSLCKSVRDSAYDVYAQCESDDLCEGSDAEVLATITEDVDDNGINLDSLFDSIRAMLKFVGEVNGHKLHVSRMFALLCVVYAGKRVNNDSPDLQFCLSKLRNRKAELETMKSLNGINPDAITEAEHDIEVLEQEKSDLLDTPDQRVKGTGRASEGAFRLDIEQHLGRMFRKQVSKTSAQLDAEEQARKDKKKAEKKAEKKTEQAKKSNKGRTKAQATAELKAEVKQDNADAIANR